MQNDNLFTLLATGCISFGFQRAATRLLLAGNRFFCSLACRPPRFDARHHVRRGK